MRRWGWVAVAALAAGMALGQTVTDPAGLPAEVRNSGAGNATGALACSVDPIKPALNFSFRFQAGYVFRAPLDVYEGAGHHWDVVLRVTPEGGQAVYLKDSLKVTGRAGAEGEVRGEFLVGEGRYRVEWSLLDDLGRVCRKQWELEARAGRNEKVLMPPGTVGDLSWRAPGGGKLRAEAYPRRVTVILNAALPATSRRENSGGAPVGFPGTRGTVGSAPVPRGVEEEGGPVARQWATLVSMVGAVVERLEGTALRMVVINLDQQRELFRQEGFGREGMNRVAHSADGLEQWAVDYRVLRNPAGAWELLAGVIDREMHAPEPSDAVVLMGLPWWTGEKMPASFPAAGGNGPRFFYLQYRTGRAVGYTDDEWGAQNPRGRRGGGAQQPTPATVSGQLADALAAGLRRLKGKTFAIYQPGDLSKAIREIETGGK